jgi:hypothetical protein
VCVLYLFCSFARAARFLRFGNVTGVSLVVGFALGLPPLVAQAFGAGNHARCGELLQRQLLIHLAVVLPIGQSARARVRQIKGYARPLYTPTKRFFLQPK